VKEQRWLWFLAAGVMLASAVAAAWSTYLYWLPCRGTMLEGTLIHPYTDDGLSYEEYERLEPAVKASMDACLRRMDGDISEQAPWTSELLVFAMVLLGVAWLTLVLGLRWQLRTKAVAALPGLGAVVAALAVAATIGDADRGEDHPLLTILPTAVEWSALLALAMIWAWQPEVRTRRRFLRIVLALWGTTAFGIFHQMFAYMIMVGFSERDWDEPPGTGYLTVATIAISAILIVIMTLRIRQTAVDGDPQPGYDSGSLTLT
jgi:amino acid transporter